jgi:hypothetical protein
MGLDITKTFVVNAPAEAVWAFLVDLPRVARCMPGAAIGEKLDERTYAGTMTIKVGPVTSSYRGKIVFEKLDAEGKIAEIVATGQDVRGKGGADMRLRSQLKEVAPGETEVVALSTVNVTGILAQMGRGMIQDVSDQLFQVFSKKMRAELEAAAAPPAPAPAAAEAEPAAAAAPAAAAPATPAAPVAPQALDLGAIGARAAGRAAARTFARPTFWLVVLVIAIVLYLWLR